MTDSIDDNADSDDILKNMEQERCKIITQSITSVSPKKIISLMNKHVVGQEKAKKILAVAIYNHIKRIGNTYFKDRPIIQKSNVILVGPTGSGKTFLIESICKELDIPYGIADATTLTEVGYWGEDPEAILLPLLHNCSMSAEQAAKGIVYIDEIDKISGSSDKGRDITGLGVQRSLLKIIEGKKTKVITSATHSSKASPTIEIDTTNILFIIGGAFSGIESIINKRLGTAEIGFVTSPKKKIKNSNLIVPEDLIKYGLIPELIGRIHSIAQLNKLTIQNLTDILTKPENSIVNQYQNLFSYDDIKLDFDIAALKLISKIAIEQGTGARALRSIMEKVLLDLMFEAPTDSATNILITKKIVNSALKK